MAAASRRTLQYVAAGTYGCVVRDTLACDTVTPLVAANPTFSDRTVSKLSLEKYTANMGVIVKVLQKVDPDHSFTVPIETICNITADERVRVVDDGQCRALITDINGSAAPPTVSQITMREGVTYYKYLIEESRKGTALHILYEQLFVFFQGIEKMHKMNIAHGDLKETNMVYFASDKKIRLIDFDMMFSYNLDPALNTGRKKYNYLDWETYYDSETLETIFDEADTEQATISNYNGETGYFPPDDVLLCKSKLRYGYWDTTKSKILPATEGLKVYMKEFDTFQCLQATWQTKLDELRDYIATLDVKTYSGTDMYHNYNPEKFTVFQLGHLLMSVFDRLRRHINLLPKKMISRMRNLVTLMMMPMAKDRIDLQDTLRLFDEWTSDLTAIEVPGFSRALAPVPGMSIIQIKFNDKVASMPDIDRYLKSLFKRDDLCRNGAGYFSHDNIKPSKTGALWFLHDEPANGNVPNQGILALALVSNSATRTYERYIHFICATKRASKYAASILFHIIASASAYKGYRTLALRAATRDLVKMYESSRYGMTCEGDLCRLSLAGVPLVHIPFSEHLSLPLKRQKREDLIESAPPVTSDAAAAAAAAVNPHEFSPPVVNIQRAAAKDSLKRAERTERDEPDSDATEVDTPKPNKRPSY